MKKHFLSLLAIFGLGLTVAIGTAWALDLAEVKCPVSGQAAKEAASLDYRGGKLYFCCKNCPKAYEKDKEKFATKANHQLASTGQASQSKCPISKEDIDEDQSLEVGGVSVKFCCKNCLASANKAEGDAQLDLLFGDKIFDDAYTVGSE